MPSLELEERNSEKFSPENLKKVTEGALNNLDKNKGMVPDVEVKKVLEDISYQLRDAKTTFSHGVNTDLFYGSFNKVKEIFVSKVNSAKGDTAKLEICDAINSALSAASEKTEEGLKWEASFSPVKDSSDKIIDFDLGFKLYAADLEVVHFKVPTPSNNDKSEIVKDESYNIDFKYGSKYISSRDLKFSESDFSSREEIIEVNKTLDKINRYSEAQWALYFKTFREYMGRAENNLKDNLSDDTFDIINSLKESRKNIISLTKDVQELLNKCSIKIEDFLQLKENMKFCDDYKNTIMNNASFFKDRSDKNKLLGKYFDNFLLTNEALSDSIKFSIKPCNVLEHEYPNALGDEGFINRLYEAGFVDYFVLEMAIEIEGIPVAWLHSYQEPREHELAGIICQAHIDGYAGEPLDYYLPDVIPSQKQVDSLLGSEKNLNKLKETLEQFATLDQNAVNQLCYSCMKEYMEKFNEALNKNS